MSSGYGHSVQNDEGGNLDRYVQDNYFKQSNHHSAQAA
jgi:hypothetical protein